MRWKIWMERINIVKPENEDACSRLFLIGNGFDIAHGYQTRYSDFERWIKEQTVYDDYSSHWPFIPVYRKDSFGQEESARNQLMKLLLHMFERLDRENAKDNWQNFEEALFYLNIEIYHDAQTEDIITEEDGITQEYIMELSEHNADNLYTAIEHIPVLFSEWIESVKLPFSQISFGTDVICQKKGRCRAGDLFLTFNYTETLEQNYNVPANQVFHIHGFRKVKSKLVVGYSDSKNRIIKLSTFGGDYQYARKRLSEAMILLQKNTTRVIQHNQDLWRRLENLNIHDIYSFGFSFSEIDLPYIAKLCSSLKEPENCCWWLSSRDKPKSERIKKAIVNSGFSGQFMYY